MSMVAAGGALSIGLTVPDVVNAPKILAAARDRLAALLKHPLRFVELHGSELLRPAERRRMEPRRLSRREAVYLVGAALLHHADVVTLRVGAPRGDGHVTPPGHEKLAELTGLSLTRLRRALREGIRAGYWTATQPRLRYRNAAGDWAYAAFRVVYRLAERFFARLGLGRRLAKERIKAAERLRDRRRIYALALLGARDARLKTRRGSRDHSGPTARQDDAENAARLLADLKLRLRQRYPDWPAERVAAEASRALRRL